MDIKNLFRIAFVFCCGLVLNSCLDDDDNDKYYANALVTVKHTSNEAIYLQLDETTTLRPINLKADIYGGKQVRALCNFKDSDESGEGYSKAVYINWIDSILTKDMVPNLGDLNTETYGNDPVEIINDWVTIAEDGYLTLRFQTVWGYSGKAHLVNLVAGDAENPYTIEFRQNSFGDVNGELRDGLVAFNLNKLPDTAGKTVKLTLKWNSFSGAKSFQFDYNSQNPIATGTLILNGRIENYNIQ